MKRLLFFLSGLVLVTVPYFIFAQQPLRRMTEINGRDVSSPVPVVFGKKEDGLSERFRLRGVITEVSFSRGCGVVWWSGTLRIKLLERVEGYPYESVFVVVNCLEDSRNKKRYLNRIVKMEVSKLYPEYGRPVDNNNFYFELIDNTIDSGRVPFYCTRMWRDEILKNTESQETHKGH